MLNDLVVWIVCVDCKYSTVQTSMPLCTCSFLQMYKPIKPQLEAMIDKGGPHKGIIYILLGPSLILEI